MPFTSQGPVTQDYGITNCAIGSAVTSSATAAAASFLIGFKPRYVRFINITDRIQYEWFDAMTVPGALKSVAAGTNTLETTEGITVFGPGAVGGTPSAIAGGIDGNGFSVPASILIASKTFSWMAMG